jgi:DNA-binding transcriptional MerR regulator
VHGGPYLRIGEVSRRSGVSVKTIRFYCDQGLIEASTRSEGGFRLFDTAILADLAAKDRPGAGFVPTPAVPPGPA